MKLLRINGLMPNKAFGLLFLAALLLLPLSAQASRMNNNITFEIGIVFT
jgi:hypothetical protein